MRKLLCLALLASASASAQDQIKGSRLQDNTVAPSKLQSSSGVPSSTTCFYGDGHWGACGAGGIPSVFGRTGAVTAQTGDYSFAQIGSTPTTLAGYGITDPVLLSSGSYSNPSWLSALAWSKLTGTPTSLAGYGIADPVLLSSGSYSNPSWLSALAWSKLTGTPTSLAGYGIADPVLLSSGSYSNPSWLSALAWSKLTGTPTSLAGYGIADPVLLSSGSYSNPSWLSALAWSKLSGLPSLTNTFNGRSGTVAPAAGDYTTSQIATSNVALGSLTGTVALDLSQGFAFEGTATGNLLLANPANAHDGDSAELTLTQDATGGRTLSFDTAYVVPSGAALSTAAGAVDVVSLRVYACSGLSGLCVRVAISPQIGPAAGTAGAKNLGTSVNDPGTGTLEMLEPPQTYAVGSHTYIQSDLFRRNRRSNSGSAMTDTLPLSSTTGLANGTWITVDNVDGSAADTVSAATGTTVDGAGSIAIPAGASIRFVWDTSGSTWHAARPIFQAGTGLALSGNTFSTASCSGWNVLGNASTSPASAACTSLSSLIDGMVWGAGTPSNFSILMRVSGAWSALTPSAGWLQSNGTTVSFAALPSATASTAGLVKASSGTAPTVAAVTGTISSGHCAQFSDTAGTIADAGAGCGAGTVTSFSAGGLSPLFTTSVATATSTPALSFTLSSQSANFVFAGPNGSAGAPSFRALVAADLPAAVATVTGATTVDDCVKISSGNVLADAGAGCGSGGGSYTAGTGISIAAGVIALSTPVSAANGGIGVGSPSAHGLLVGEGSSAAASVAAGTAGQVLQSGGASADPAWAENQQSMAWSTSNSSIAAGTTTYNPLGTIVPIGTETAVTTSTAITGKIGALYVNANGAVGASNTATITLFVNGSSTSLTCQIAGASATTCSDTTSGHAASVTAGQRISIQIVTSAGATPRVYGGAIQEQWP